MCMSKAVAPPACPQRGHVPAERSRVRGSAVITPEDALHSLGGSPRHNPLLDALAEQAPNLRPTSQSLFAVNDHVRAGREIACGPFTMLRPNAQWILKYGTSACAWRAIQVEGLLSRKWPLGQMVVTNKKQRCARRVYYNSSYGCTLCG